MEAFLITAVRTLFGEREMQYSSNVQMIYLQFLGIAQRYTDHLNAKWYADHNDRLQKALSSCHKLRSLSDQTIEDTLSSEVVPADTVSGSDSLGDQVSGNAASDVTIRGAPVSRVVTSERNGPDDIFLVSDIPALTRTQTLESSCAVPPTPVWPHAAVEYPLISKTPSRYPRQISDRESISYTVNRLLSLNPELDSNNVTQAEVKVDLHKGLAWAGYGRKIRTVRKVPASGSPTQYEVVEEPFEGDYPVNSAEMVGEGAFRISRLANVDEALQELKQRFGPHIHVILQMSIRLLGKDAKVRGHRFTYDDLYCMLYEHATKARKSGFIVKTLDDGCVVQEGFPVKPLPLKIHPRALLYPTGDQIYRAEAGSSLSKFSDTANANEAVGVLRTKQFARTNRSSNTTSKVTKRVRAANKAKGAVIPLPTARAPTSRQPQPRVRFACDIQVQEQANLKSSHLSPRTASTVVHRDEVLTFIQQAQILGSSKQDMDVNDSAGHDLSSRPRPRGHPLSSLKPKMDANDGTDYDLISRPISRPLDHSLGLSKQKTDTDESVDRDLSSQPISRPLGHSLSSTKQKMDTDDSTGHDLFSRPLPRPVGHPLGSFKQNVPTNETTDHDLLSRHIDRPLSPLKKQIELDNSADHDLFARPLDRSFGHSLGHSLNSIKQQLDLDNGADRDHFSRPLTRPLGHPLGPRVPRTTNIPNISKELVDHERTVTNLTELVQNLDVSQPTSTKEDRPEYYSTDYKEIGSKPDSTKPQVANSNPVPIRRRTTDRDMGLSCNLANTSYTPSLSSQMHPLSFRNPHAPRIGSPLRNALNFQQQESDLDESDDDTVPDFVDRSGN